MKIYLRGEVYDSDEESILIQTSKHERDCIHNVPEDTKGIFLVWNLNNESTLEDGQALMDEYKEKVGIPVEPR